METAVLFPIVIMSGALPRFSAMALAKELVVGAHQATTVKQVHHHGVVGVGVVLIPNRVAIEIARHDCLTLSEQRAVCAQPSEQRVTVRGCLPGPYRQQIDDETRHYRSRSNGWTEYEAVVTTVMPSGFSSWPNQRS